MRGIQGADLPKSMNWQGGEADSLVGEHKKTLDSQHNEGKEVVG